MPRIQPVDPNSAEGNAKRLLDNVQGQWGMTPALVRTMANAPAALEAYLGVNDALSRGVLSAELREQIALAVAEANRSAYCLAAHSAIGKAVGLSEEEVMDSRRGVSPDRRVEAALQFARQVVDQRGWVADEDVAQLKDVGYDDEEIIEIIANVAMNLFTNYFNQVAGTAVDFPLVRELASV